MADLVLLDQLAGGAIRADIIDVVRSGMEPELLVRRDLSDGADLPRWFVGIRASGPDVDADENTGVEHEVNDPRVIATLAGVWLADLRGDVMAELRLRLDRGRGRG